jgi:hypothetical protein
MHVVYYITYVTNKAHKIVNCPAGQSRLQPAQVLLSPVLAASPSVATTVLAIIAATIPVEATTATA